MSNEFVYNPLVQKLVTYGFKKRSKLPYLEKPCTLPGLPLKEVGVLFGEGGVGKSYLILQLAMSLAARGSKFDLDLFKNLMEQPRHEINKIIYFSLEDSLEIIDNRLACITEHHEKINQKIMADPNGYDKLLDVMDEKIMIIGIDELMDLDSTLIINKKTHNSPETFIVNNPIFNHTLQQMEELDLLDGSLLILDPLSHLLSGNENDNVEMSALMRHIHKNIARKYNCSVLITHHVNKSNEGGAAAARGASAITANARWAARLFHDKERQGGSHPNIKPIKFEVVKINHGEAYSQNFEALKVYKGVLTPVANNQKPADPKSENQYKSYKQRKIIMVDCE